jgi:hypothetical protein
LAHVNLSPINYALGFVFQLALDNLAQSLNLFSCFFVLVRRSALKQSKQLSYRNEKGRGSHVGSK